MRERLSAILTRRSEETWPYLRGVLAGAAWAVLVGLAYETFVPQSGPDAFAHDIAELTRSLGPEAGPKLEAAVGRLAEAAALVEREHASLTLTEDVTARMLDGALGALDPYSGFIDEGSASALISDEDVDHRKQVGLLVSPGDEVYRIEAIAPGSPADDADLRPGDVVVGIDGRDVRDLGPYRINEMILEILARDGEDPLRLRVDRPGQRNNIDLVVHPADIEPVSAFDLGVEDRVLHVLVTGFYRGVTSDVRDLITRANRLEPLRGVVLDLRNNGGGLTEEALELAELFLPKGTLVYEMTGRALGVEKIRTREAPLFPDIGLTVLVNGGSASASEIIAAALQVHKRAKIVGWQSYGKGTVQRLFPIDHGAIKITVAEYTDAGLRKINGVGVTPNVQMDSPDPRLRPSRFERDSARDIARRLARTLGSDGL